MNQCIQWREQVSFPVSGSPLPGSSCRRFGASLASLVRFWDSDLQALTWLQALRIEQLTVRSVQPTHDAASGEERSQQGEGAVATSHPLGEQPSTGT